MRQLEASRFYSATGHDIRLRASRSLCNTRATCSFSATARRRVSDRMPLVLIACSRSVSQSLPITKLIYSLDGLPESRESHFPDVRAPLAGTRFIVHCQQPLVQISRCFGYYAYLWIDRNYQIFRILTTMVYSCSRLRIR